MTGTRSATSLLAAVIVTAGLVAGCGSDTTGPAGRGPNDPETTKITVAFGTNSASTTPLWLAADEGFFKKHGLDVKVVEATSTVGATAVVAGKAQFFLGEATSTFQAAAQGTKASIVATMQDLNIFKLYVNPSITDAAQLKGKPIAISAAADSTELSTRAALKQLNVDPATTTLLQTGSSSNRLAALVTGRVKGTLLSEPSASKAKSQGMKLLLDQTKEPFVAGAVTIAKSFGDKNPNTVTAFLEAMEEGLHFLTDPANKAECLKVIAKYEKAKPTAPDVAQGYAQYSGDVLSKDPYPNFAGGDQIVVGLKSLDPRRFGSITTKQVYDTTFADKLRSSGFLKTLWGAALTGSPAPSSPAASPS